MYAIRISGILFVQWLVLVSPLMSQGTLADYRRSEAVDSLYKDKVYNHPLSFHWLKNSAEFWYMNKTRDGKEFIMIDVKNRSRSPAFDHSRLSDTLSRQTGKSYSPGSLPFDKIDFTDSRDSLLITVDSARWRCNLSSYSCEVVEILKDEEKDSPYWGNFFNEKGNDPVRSPDSLWVAFIRDSNVYAEELKTGEKHQLSFDGTPGEFYSGHMQWSPDSKMLMAYKVRPGAERQIFFVESSPEDQLQPRVCYRDYLKPGDALPIKSPQLFIIKDKKHAPVSNAGFRRQFSLSNFEWRKDSRAFTFEYNERGHQNYKVIEVSAPEGKINVLVEERSETFIDYSGKKYRHDVNDGREIIWASERDGWNHLYLYDGNTGKVKNQITRGEWVVRKVVRVDEEKRQIIFAASGLDPDQDPYLLHYCRINFDGSGFKRLTWENANHSATFPDDYKYFVDSYSRVDLPPVAVLRRSADGKILMTLEEADISGLLSMGWGMPEVFSAKGRDGKTDIWGMIIRPSHFDPSKVYPVIEYIYAGPHGSHVPKNFQPYFWAMHPLAELGFIVVQIDGMGTSNRSKSFHDVCWKNLKDAGFPDRIAWIKAAAGQYNYLDISNVGIYGGSAGGQSAAGALIFHPGFYKVAVASCGCHDNRMDKIWWNEQWMGYPVGPHYAASSNVVNANKLERKLMLIVGELDDNVDPASTMQMVDALIKAGKNFELIVIPGMGHSLGGDYGEKKRRDFFVKHLLGVEPPDWNGLGAF